jgi:hypothetical protein
VERPTPPPGGNPTPAPIPGPVEIVPPGVGPPPAPTIDEAVRKINGLYVRGAISTAIAIADYLLEQFLDGDEEALDRAGDHPTLRQIADHQGLRFLPPYLWNALLLRRQLPVLAETAGQLTFSQQRLLLGVTQAAPKLALARRVVSKRLGLPALSAEVSRWRALHHEPPLGRPPQDPVVAAARRMAAAAREAVREAKKRPVPGLSRADLPGLIESTERSLRQLRALAAKPPAAPRSTRGSGK